MNAHFSVRFDNIWRVLNLKTSISMTSRRIPLVQVRKWVACLGRSVPLSLPLLDGRFRGVVDCRLCVVEIVDVATGFAVFPTQKSSPKTVYIMVNF